MSPRALLFDAAQAAREERIVAERSALCASPLACATADAGVEAWRDNDVWFRLPPALREKLSELHTATEGSSLRKVKP